MCLLELDTKSDSDSRRSVNTLVFPMELFPLYGNADWYSQSITTSTRKPNHKMKWRWRAP